jgi:hypothetical protein
MFDFKGRIIPFDDISGTRPIHPAGIYFRRSMDVNEKRSILNHIPSSS